MVVTTVREEAGEAGAVETGVAVATEVMAAVAVEDPGEEVVAWVIEALAELRSLR